MFELLLAIIGMVLTILFVVGTHEFAHFITARLLGVKVLQFSIGFGKKLLHYTDKQGTEYVLALIPLGGYVRMLDETEGPVPAAEKHLAYNRQPYYKKFLIVFAGPTMNFLCALFLYWFIFVIGFVAVRPIIGDVLLPSIAKEAGLTAKQEIVAVDGHHTSSWTSVLLRLIVHIGTNDQAKIAVKSNNEKTTTHLLNLSHWQLDPLDPDLLKSLGITPYEPDIPLVIGIMQKHSPVTLSPLKIGDKIIAIDQKKMHDWEELITTIKMYPEKKLTFTIERQGKLLQLPVTIGYERIYLFKKVGYLGIRPNFEWPAHLLHKIQYSPIPAFSHACRQMVDVVYLNGMLFLKMLTGKISIQSLGGPITILESAGKALNFGFISFLAFLAFLSISIGFINFLPIPGLDGGHLFIQTVEFIIRRPIPFAVLSGLYRLGVFIILLLLIQALVNDILRLF